MNSKKLVPSIKLCEQIPEGMFEDSYFVYVKHVYMPETIVLNKDSFKNFEMTIPEPIPRSVISNNLDENEDIILVPAPMLPEILEKCNSFELHKTNNADSEYLCANGNNYVYDEHCVEAALKFWFTENKIFFIF